MAERRMFSKTVIDSDSFLDMPMSAQLLYFHLSMRADDDGFLNNPKKIQRMIGASDDDLKLLILKSFLITFDTGVVVIKHWKIHNYIQSDRYKPTIYAEEKSLLSVNKNKAYTLSNNSNNCIQGVSEQYPRRIQCVSDMDTECIHDVYRPIVQNEFSTSQNRMDTDGYNMDTECIHNGYSSDTQDRLGKINNINKPKGLLSDNENLSDTEQPESEIENPKQYDDIISEWNTLEDLGITPLRIIGPNSERGRLLRARIKQYGRDSFTEIVSKIRESDFLQGRHDGRFWQVTFDWVIKPNNYPKVLEGNYDNKPQQNSNSRVRNFCNIQQSYSSEDIAEIEAKLLDN